MKLESKNNLNLLQTYKLKKVHRIIGVICYIVARVNIAIGLNVIYIADTLFYLFIGYCLFVILLMAKLEYNLRKKRELEEDY